MQNYENKTKQKPQATSISAYDVVCMYAYLYIFPPKSLASSVHIVLARSLLTLENYFSNKQICIISLFLFLLPIKIVFTF